MYKKFDLFFGFFVIAVFCWFLYEIVSSSLRLSGSYKNLNAVFSSASGIGKGSSVRIAGVKIGEVADIMLDKKHFTAIVKMKLDASVQIPTDSSASIQSTGFIGEKYIEIEPGMENSNFKSGDKITMTQSSPNLEKLINLFVSSKSSPSK